MRSARPVRLPNQLIIDEPSDRIPLPCASVHVRGWVTFGNALPMAVRVRFTGSDPVHATIGQHREDLGGHFSLDGPAMFGWSVDLPLPDSVPATRELVVEAVDATGSIPMVARRTCTTYVDRTSDDALGLLDTPSAVADIEGNVMRIGGWVVFPGGRTRKVSVEVNGVIVAAARTFVARGDVGKMFAFPDAPVSGFEHVLTLPPSTTATSVAVRVIADAMDGRSWRSETSIVNMLPRPSWDDGHARAMRARTAALGNGTAPAQDPIDTLVFTHSLELGGGQLWLTELLSQMQLRTDNRCAVVSVGDGVLRAGLEAQGIDVHTTVGFPVGSIDEYEGRVRELALLIRASGCSSVLVNTLGMFPAVDAAMTVGIPVLWAIHESFVTDEFLFLNYGFTGAHPYARSRLPATLEAADALVFEASQTGDLFAPYTTVEQRRVVDYGIDTAEIQNFVAGFDRAQARADEGFDEDDVVMLVMGVFEPRKAQALLVAAFEELGAIHPKLRLVMVGAHPSPYLDAIREQVGRGRFASRIHLVPITSDIQSWYAMADLFLCASDVESLPRSVLEAMAYGVPVVSTNVFGLATLISDGSTGWLCQARDLGSLTATLHRVLSLAPAERAQVAGHARDMVLRERDSERYAVTFGTMLADLGSREFAVGTPEREKAEGEG